MLEGKLKESGEMVNALEKELVEDIRLKYKDVSEVIDKVVSNIENARKDLLRKVDLVYEMVESRK